MLSMEEKIERFVAAIEADARSESDVIQREIERETEAALTAAEDDALNETYRYIKARSADERTRSGRGVSRHMMARKNAINARRERMAEQVMESVRARLSEYVQTPAYAERLKKSARDAWEAIGRGDTTLYLREADMPLQGVLADALKDAAASVGAAPKVTFKAGDMELGGLTAVSAATNLMADETFDTKFEELRGHFAELFGLQLSK